MTTAQEAWLWMALCICPGQKIHYYDFPTNTYYTVRAYKYEGDYLWADKEYGIDIRKWGAQQPYEQIVVRHRKDVLSPLRRPWRTVERYDASGNEIWNKESQ